MAESGDRLNPRHNDAAALMDAAIIKEEEQERWHEAERRHLIAESLREILEEGDSP